uniref:(northern house mosquito) hypothetical protein n=1 Tax=Culex pipiens TaxID=7175 RepID=A0A8D8GNV2_CULPI
MLRMSRGVCFGGTAAATLPGGSPEGPVEVGTAPVFDLFCHVFVRSCVGVAPVDGAGEPVLLSVLPKDLRDEAGAVWPFASSASTPGVRSGTERGQHQFGAAGIFHGSQHLRRGTG